MRLCIWLCQNHQRSIQSYWQGRWRHSSRVLCRAFVLAGWCLPPDPVLHRRRIHEWRNCGCAYARERYSLKAHQSLHPYVKTAVFVNFPCHTEFCAPGAPSQLLQPPFLYSCPDQPKYRSDSPTTRRLPELPKLAFLSVLHFRILFSSTRPFSDFLSFGRFSWFSGL